MSAPLLVFRLGYMAYYDGVGAIANGGSYPVATGEAGEMWNFRVTNGRCYGYVRTSYNENKEKITGVNLSFIDSKIKQGDEIEGIDIIFVAKKPKVGQVVVGWYKNATVFHQENRQMNVDTHEYGYLCEVDKNNAFLLPEEKRTFLVPCISSHDGGSGFMRDNVWYPQQHSQIKEVSTFIKKLRKYIDSYSVPAIGELLGMPIKDLINHTQNLGNSKPRKIKVTSTSYDRNPLVVALAKKLAGGKCQLCKCDAPFEKDGEPYLEVHHVKWLSKDGFDSPKNVVALCPNCHRKMHSLNLAEDVAALTKIAESQW